MQHLDWVLLKNAKCERGSKLEPKWERTPYLVEKQPFSLTPVYDVVSESSEPIKRPFHHNLLRSCILSGICSTKMAAVRRDDDPEDVLLIPEVSFE